jgi:hypothetical protein
MANDASLEAAEREAPHLSANARAAGRVSPTLLRGMVEELRDVFVHVVVDINRGEYAMAHEEAVTLAQNAQALAAELRAVLRS